MECECFVYYDINVISVTALFFLCGIMQGSRHNFQELLSFYSSAIAIFII